jgi:hypothetical protein
MVFYHGTSSDRLPSIARLGLLPPKQLYKKTAHRVRYPKQSIPTKTYVTDRIAIAEAYARQWKNRVGAAAVLRVKPVSALRPDRDFEGTGVCHDNLLYEEHTYEHLGRVPPENIEVKTRAGWKPLLELYG